MHQTQRNNRKVNRVEESRKKQIEKENEILVEKMTRTVLRAPSHQHVSGSSSSYPSSHHKDPATVNTLNYQVRKQERERILQENARLARRLISETRPTLSRSEWQQHAHEHQRLRNSLAKFEEVPVDTIEQARRALRKEMMSGSGPRDENRGSRRKSQSPVRSRHGEGRTFVSLREEGAIGQFDQSHNPSQHQPPPNTEHPAILPPLNSSSDDQARDNQADDDGDVPQQ